MPHTLRDFLTGATPKAAAELAAALLRIPEDKRNWKPEGKARTALDQIAECALLNGNTAELIQTRTWVQHSFEDFLRAKAEAAAQDWERLHALLQENTNRVVAVIRAVPDDALSVEIELPWGKSTLAEIISYPYWNMTYHLGQINYIASM